MRVAGQPTSRVALVCGVTGQDGAYLSRLLLSKGYEVWGTSRNAEEPRFRNLELLGLRESVHVVSMVPDDFRSVFVALRKIRPDEIYYLAGQSSVGISFAEPWLTLQSITVGLLNVLEACRLVEHPIRLFNAGSSECFGDTGGAPADEDTPLRPDSPYGVAKTSAHWLVKTYRNAYGIFACTGILFNHESPLRPPRFATQKIITAVKEIAAGSADKLRLGRLDIQRDWGWAPEYVDAMWRMLQQDTPDDLVIATGKAYTLGDFVATAFSLRDLKWEDHVESAPELYRPTERLTMRGNPARARTVLGWAAQKCMPDVVSEMLAGGTG